VSTTELVANLWSSTLSKKNFDDASVVVVVRNHHLVHIARLNAAFEATKHATPERKILHQIRPKHLSEIGQQ